MLAFDAATASFSYDRGLCSIRGWRVSVEVDGTPYRTGDETVVTRLVASQPLEVAATLGDTGVECRALFTTDEAAGTVTVRIRLTNTGGRPRAIGKVRPLEAAGPVVVGSTAEDVVCLPFHNRRPLRSVYALSDPECPTESQVHVQLYNRTQHAALQVGFVTFRRALTTVTHAFDRERGLTALAACADYAGWTLEAGAGTEAETLTVMAGEDPHAQLEGWADAAAALAPARRWEDAPIGWLGWAWADPLTTERYEDVVLRNCSAIRERLAGFGVDYIWVSLGNIADVAPGRWLEWNPELFPSGPVELSRRLQALGFTLGLWCGAFWVCASCTREVEALSDALIRNPDGSPLVVVKEWRWGAAGWLPREERPVIYALDPTHPLTHALHRKVFSTYRKWGVRYYMIDFLHAAAGSLCEFPYERHHDGSLVSGPEAYHRGLQVIREAAGDDTHILTSTGPTLQNAGFSDGVRTGNDFGEGRPMYPDSHFFPATYVINNAGFWTGPARALQNQAASYYTHRRLYLNNSGNVLTVDQPLPLSDARIHATIHAMSGGHSMLGDEIAHLSEERLALIKKTLPRSRDVAFPVDLFDAIHPASASIFQRTVRQPWGRHDVIAVYNLSEEPVRRRIGMNRLGLEAGAGYLVWEFWNEHYLGRVTDSLDVLVPAGSVCVYRLTSDTGRPLVLATDMHLLMGEVEILRCEWDTSAMRLEGTAIRPSGERGSVFVHAPSGLRVANPRGLHIAKDGRDSSLVIRVPLAFPEGRAEFSVAFADAAGYTRTVAGDLA